MLICRIRQFVHAKTGYIAKKASDAEKAGNGRFSLPFIIQNFDFV